ncbi:MAG: glycosyltransferase family 39 protein [Patescibacteria group bacterium]|jgi:4-amino-4-deoxy-L-arabinose transferase-like glycosyltransferase|nr:glycosyltransferase family 39 protein [Patescibacteria group bacterium]
MEKKTILYLLIILIIAGFFRLANLKTIPPGLYPDEAMNGNNALFALENKDFKLYYPENNGREGLFINIQAFFLKLFLKFYSSPEAWMLRIVSAIFGILTVFGLFLLAKELFNEKIALLSSLFLAFNFWHVNFSRIGFRAIMVPFLLVWSLYFLIVGMKKIKIVPIIVSGIIFGLGFHTYIAFRMAPFIALIILFFQFVSYRKNNQLKNFWKLVTIWIIFVVLAALPMIIYFLNHPQDFMGRATQVSIFEKPNPLWEFLKSFIKTLTMFNFVGDGNWRHNLPHKPQLDFILGFFFLVGIYTIIKEIINKKLELDNILIISWFLLMSLPAAFTYEGIPHALRSIGMIPPTLILSGLGAYSFYEFIKKQFSLNKTIWILLFLIALSLIINYRAYFLVWAKNYNAFYAFNGNYYEIGKYLNQLPKESLKIVLVNAGGVLVNNIPMPAQTVMFLTNTYSIKNQNEKNIIYLLPNQLNLLHQFSSFILVPLEKDEKIKNAILQQFPSLSFYDYPYFWIFQSQ